MDADVIRLMRERAAVQVWLTLADAGQTHDFDDVARAAGLARAFHADSGEV